MVTSTDTVWVVGLFLVTVVRCNRLRWWGDEEVRAHAQPYTTALPGLLVLSLSGLTVLCPHSLLKASGACTYTSYCFGFRCNA